MATMAVAKGMLHNPNQYTDLLMIHSGIHAVMVKCAGALSC